MIGKASILAAASAPFLILGAATGGMAKEKKPVLVSYKKDSGVGLGAWGGKLLHSYGYKDKKLESGTLEITGQAKSDLPEHSQYIALFRAAELAASENKKFVRILSVNGKSLRTVFTASTPTGTLSGGHISYGTRYVIEVEFSDSPDEVDNCANDVLRQSCKTLDVEAVMQEIRPHLKFKK